jgi:hypothetical protein
MAGVYSRLERKNINVRLYHIDFVIVFESFEGTDKDIVTHNLFNGKG